MIIDLDNPAHVEALRWAAEQIGRGSNLARELLGSTVRAGLWAEREAAVRAFTDPTVAAYLVRRLLQRCGVHSARVDRIEPDGLNVAWGYAEACEDHDASGCEHGASGEVDVDLARIPRVALGLLDIRDRDTVNMWLDDVRPAPIGCTHVTTIDAAKTLLSTGTVRYASLDHDLGQCESCASLAIACPHVGTGYDLVKWMAETGHWPSVKPVVHSANPVGRAYMATTIDRYWTNPMREAALVVLRGDT